MIPGRVIVSSRFAHGELVESVEGRGPGENPPHQNHLWRYGAGLVQHRASLWCWGTSDPAMFTPLDILVVCSEKSPNALRAKS
jgi:hypothetical protein